MERLLPQLATFASLLYLWGPLLKVPPRLGWLRTMSLQEKETYWGPFKSQSFLGRFGGVLEKAKARRSAGPWEKLEKHLVPGQALCLCLSDFFSFIISFSLNQSGFSIPVSLSLCVWAYISLSLSISLWMCFPFLPPAPHLYSVSCFLCVSLFLLSCVCVSVFLCVSLGVFLSVSLSLCVCLCVFLPVECMWFSPCLSPSPLSILTLSVTTSTLEVVRERKLPPQPWSLLDLLVPTPSDNCLSRWPFLV